MWLFLLFIMSFSIFSPAKELSVVEHVMAASTLAEIKTILHRSEEEKVLYQRCQSELRGSYLPSYCYVWLERENLPVEQKKFLRRTLDDLCVRRLEDGIAVGDKNWQHMQSLSPLCQKSLKAWLQIKLYKLNQENSAQLFSRSDIGKAFESISGHATTKSVSQNRVSTARAFRRRLN